MFISDPKVKVILVNVFGGIVNCATIANGVIAASRKLGLKIPLVVRLEGKISEKKIILCYLFCSSKIYIKFQFHS